MTAGIANVVGTGKLLDNSTSTFYDVNVSASNTNQTYVFLSPLDGTNVDIGPTSPFTFAADDQITVKFTVPIAEWAGSGTVNLAQNDVEYAYNTSTSTSSDTSSFGYGPQGVALVTSLPGASAKRVRFQTPIQSSSSLVIEVSTDRVTWYPASNARIGAATVNIIPSMSSGGNLLSGVQLVTVNSTDVDVLFAQYASAANDDSPGTDWPSDAYWRVRKSSAGAAVGFGIVVPGTSSGLVSASGLPGNTSGAAIASGYVGQMLNTQQSGTGGKSYYTSNATTLTGSFVSVVSTSVNKGVYLVTGHIGCGNSTTAQLSAYMTIGGTQASPQVNTVASTSANGNLTLVFPIVITSDATTVGISANCGGTPTSGYNTLSIVRIA
jgi:hypothetical protein